MIPPSTLLSANISTVLHVVKQGKTLRNLAAFTSSSPNRTTSSTHRFFSTGEVPFYGAPRPSPSVDTNNGTASDSWKKRLSLTLQNAATAFSDPTRADAVAAVGELTGLVALQQMRDAMMQDPVGRQILAERPVVSKETIPYETFMAEAAVRELASKQEHNDDNDTATANTDTTPITFGQAYGTFLSQHGFDPDERSQVLYIQDPELAYVMLRYRQCHDFWHALTALPPTVTGELGLKWLELFQTGLPLAALSSTVGSLGLSYQQQHVLWNIYLPWARTSGQKLPYCALMNVYYEKEWDTPLRDLRERLQLEPAPQNVEG
jgi:ubiquinone biosynthesis protein COQ4